MKEQLEKRLKELKKEFEAGEKMLAELDSKQNNLKSTLLRISGAIQVLEEQLESENKAQSGDNGHHDDAKEILTQEVDKL